MKTTLTAMSALALIPLFTVLSAAANIAPPPTEECEPMTSISGTSGYNCPTQNIWAQSSSSGVCPDGSCSFSDFKSVADDCDYSTVSYAQVGTEIKPVYWDNNVRTWTHAAITPDCGSASPGGKAKYITMLILDADETELGSMTRKFVCSACD